MHIPREARLVVAAPPRVAIVTAAVDGALVPADAPLELPYRRNRLELHFAALSYRDPALLRYRMRMRDDEAWGEPATDPEYRFVDIAPGRYAISVAASLDGQRWSETPARFEFFVGKPFYLEAWFAGAIALLATAALALAYRVRMARILGLERQRARIAQDLHDELGAGLGGIGIMAGLASRPDLDPGRRADLAERIAAHSADLGSALTDIVWSLRPGATRLRSLVAHLADRGSAMFADGNPRFEVLTPPDLPDLPLALAVRRNIVLIGLEALHNAKRHAGAERVVLRVEVERRRVRLSIADDGGGLDEVAEVADPALQRGGMGLGGMRRRAAEIGADLRIASGPDGTTVRVEFHGLRAGLGFGSGA
jgi:signal transduction histidine kinase